MASVTFAPTCRESCGKDNISANFKLFVCGRLFGFGWCRSAATTCSDAQSLLDSLSPTSLTIANLYAAKMQKPLATTYNLRERTAKIGSFSGDFLSCDMLTETWCSIASPRLDSSEGRRKKQKRSDSPDSESSEYRSDSQLKFADESLAAQLFASSGSQSMNATQPTVKLEESTQQEAYTTLKHSASKPSSRGVKKLEKEKETSRRTSLPDQKPFACEFCRASFMSELQRSKHHNAHKKGRLSHVCSQCEVAVSNLNIHMRIHTNTRPFQCPHCDQAFTVSGSLNRHLRTHSGARPYKCPNCPKACSSSSDLKKHLRIHSGERPYKCNLCPKAFTVSGSLKNHLRTHTGERPYQCNQCAQSFTRSGDLKNHMRIHTGDRPYKCTECSKAFSVSGSLKNHLRTHTGERPYTCGGCQKSFTTSSDLKKHRRFQQCNSSDGSESVGSDSVEMSNSSPMSPTSSDAPTEDDLVSPGSLDEDEQGSPARQDVDEDDAGSPASDEEFDEQESSPSSPTPFEFEVPASHAFVPTGPPAFPSAHESHLGEDQIQAKDPFKMYDFDQDVMLCNLASQLGGPADISSPFRAF
eukprot:g73352.t1